MKPFGSNHCFDVWGRVCVVPVRSICMFAGVTVRSIIKSVLDDELELLEDGEGRRGPEEIRANGSRHESLQDSCTSLQRNQITTSLLSFTIQHWYD